MQHTIDRARRDPALAEADRRSQQLSLSRRSSQRHMIIIPGRSALPGHRHTKNTSHLVRVTGECSTGDFPTVVVPAGQPVEFDLTSQDVVHAFWLPDFAAKRDAYPDHINTLRMVFPQQGRWRGRCSEYCGTHHVTMDFYVQVVSPAQYQQFLHSGGAGVTGA